MKNISTELKAHIQGEVTTLATCWKLTRKDSTVFGFTNHDQDINFESQLYKANTGFTPTSVQSSASFAVDNMELDGILSSGFIEENDLKAGLYDHAEIEIFMVNYKDLTQGKMNLKRGWIGEVRYGKDYFIAELRGLTQRLSQQIGDVFSPLCRVILGDSKCGVDLNSFKNTGSVTSVTSRQILTDTSLVDESGYYNFGKITFTSGLNSGISMEVKDFREGGQITLFLPMPFDVAVSDSFEITAGCDKNFSTCINKFNNAVNFRGEPHVPGLDEILKTSGTI